MQDIRNEPILLIHQAYFVLLKDVKNLPNSRFGNREKLCSYADFLLTILIICSWETQAAIRWKRENRGQFCYYREKMTESTLPHNEIRSLPNILCRVLCKQDLKEREKLLVTCLGGKPINLEMTILKIEYNFNRIRYHYFGDNNEKFGPYSSDIWKCMQNRIITKGYGEFLQNLLTGEFFPRIGQINFSALSLIKVEQNKSFSRFYM
jgi:hypothetical protein